MSLRRWFKERMLAGDSVGDDVPPGTSLVNSLLGRGEERVRSLGEYDSTSYPTDLRTLLARREEVTRELLGMNIIEPEGRIAAIPRLRELLGVYPHPLAYETIIHAYLDADRFDEAKGVAFAATQRRAECAASPHPEIRNEIESLNAWSIADIDEYRVARGK